MDNVHRIGVVTVTYNSAEVLPDFLESVAKQTLSDFYLYVVDNASKDKSIDIVTAISDSRVRVIANTENLGVAEGNNQGIRAALAENCDAVLLLNNDTVFLAGLFASLCDGLIRNGCAMTTPKIYYHDKPKTIWAAGGFFQPWLAYRTQHYGDGHLDIGQFDAMRSVTYAPTCCVLIHRCVFDRIGVMDPLYFVYVDDVDFMYRALKAGIVMKYLPNCQLWHKASSLTGQMSQFTVRYTCRNRAYFMRKNLPILQAWIWYVLYRFYYVTASLTRRRPRTFLHLSGNSAKQGWNMTSHT